MAFLTICKDKVWGQESNSMQQWQKADVRNGRPSSDLRIYCDNDERFHEMDPKDEPKGLPTSKERHQDEKYYVDSINKIKVKGLPACHGNAVRTDGYVVMAATSGGKSGVLYREAPFESFSRVSVTVSYIHDSGSILLLGRELTNHMRFAITY